jgi:hypothetical protein
MKTCSWTRLLVSIGSIGGLLMLLSQVSVPTGEAQSLEGETLVAQATPTDQPDESAAPTLIRSFLLYGGAFQLVDSGGGACIGQCQVANALTGGCTCPSGYTPLPSARILVDVTGGPCGSFLYICAK